MQRNKITKPVQFDTLIEELHKKPFLAKSFKKDEWDEIANKVNLQGPPVRSAEGWHKVWKDFKAKVKKKMMHNKAEMKGSGGGCFAQPLLTPNEEIASYLIGLNNQVNPNGDLFIVTVKEEIDCFNSLDENETNTRTSEEVIKIAPSESKPNSTKSILSCQIDESHSGAFVEDLQTPTPNRFIDVARIQKQKSSEKEVRAKARAALLKKQTSVQENLYKDVKSSLKAIEAHCKNTAEHQKNVFEIQSKRYNLHLSSMEKQEELIEEQKKNQKLDYEIKKKKIELLELQISLLKKQL